MKRVGIMLLSFLLAVRFEVLANSSYVLPEAAGVIDVTAAPFYADNTGLKDCSDALQKAFTYAASRTKGIFTKDERAVQIIYFPAGEYKVSKPLIFASKEIQELHKKRAEEMQMMYISAHTMIWGEGKENTKIVLDEHSEAFQEGEVPLIRFLDAKFCNTGYYNGIRHISIEIGKGNPGAVAVDYVSSNNGELCDVDIICRDNDTPAAIGLNLPIRGGGLSYIHEVGIYGFRTGIAVKGDYPGFTFENIKLEGQHTAGIHHVSKNIAIRGLYSKNACPALVLEGKDAITTLIDAELEGGDVNASAIRNEGHLLLRNIGMKGYGKMLEGIALELVDGRLDEYVSTVVRLSDAAPSKTLSLPIKNAPLYEFPSPKDWSIFDVSAQDDDTEALQKLIDSGAEYIFVKAVKERLKLRGTVHLRNNLKWLHGGWCNMDVENESEIGSPLFIFEDGRNEVMIMEAFSTGQYRNTFTTFVNWRNKTTVIRDMFMGYGDSSYRNYGTGDLFLENVVTGGGDYPELPEHKKAGWLFEHQNVWFRNLNPEEWVPDIHVGKGAVVFGLGGKLGELYGTHLRVSDGGKAEIYGIMCNINMTVPYHWPNLEVHGSSMTGITIEVDNADVSLGVFQDGSDDFPDPTFIREINGKDTYILKHKDAPKRKGDGVGSVVAPLYRSTFKTTNK